MILALLAMAVQAPPSPQRVLIQDVTVVSPERQTPLRHGYVVLEDDRIAAVGQGTPPAARWDTVIVGGGRVLIPGLIDGHTHLAVPAGLPLPLPADLQPLAARLRRATAAELSVLRIHDRRGSGRVRPGVPRSARGGAAPPRHLRLRRRAPAGERVSDGDGPERSELGALPQLPLRSAAEGRDPYPIPAGGPHSPCGRRPGGGGQRDLREDFRGARLRSGEEPAYADARR